MNRLTASSVALTVALGATTVMAQAGTAIVPPEIGRDSPGGGRGAGQNPAIARPGGDGGADSVTCWANCDNSVVPPYPGCLNVLDFACFLNQYATASTLGHAAQVAHYANCDESSTAPVLNVLDFACFLNRYFAGCTGC